MNKVIDKGRRAVFSMPYATLIFAALVVVIACVLGYFARDLTFYEFDTTAAAYHIEVEQAKLDSLVPVAFEYEGDVIHLIYDDSITPEDISVYGNSRFGVAKLTQENLDQLDETFLGAFVAVCPKQSYDIDGDGQNENVFYSVKTDLRAVQSNSTTTPMLSDAKVILEVGLNRARQLFIYYQTKPLGGRTVTIHFEDGTSKEFETDEFGCITGLTVAQIRSGLCVEYSPNGFNTYMLRYMPETTKLFSPALTPFLILLALTVGCIVLCLVIRRIGSKRHGKGFAVTRTHKPAFVIVRWIVMIFSFLLLTWGGAWLGYWFEELYFPVLWCSKYNQEQIVSSSCYYMSHLSNLFTLPWQTIATFLACFLIPVVLFGKLICGFICPMGFVQDTLHVVRQKTGAQGIAMTDKLYERLAIIKWTAVMIFLGMGFAGLDFCNVCPVVTLSPAFSGFKTSIYVSGFLMVFVLVGSFFKHRFFCNICPLGLIMGLFHKVSAVRLKKDCTACTECGACYSACPMGIKSIYTERERVDVTTTNCIMCGECIRNCPEDDALRLTVAGKTLYKSSREGFMKRYENKDKKVKTCK